jgi:hypothetical protein
MKWLYKLDASVAGIVPFTGAQPRPELLRVPAGFNIALWRTGLSGARSLASVQVDGATIVYVGSNEGSGRVGASDI